MRWCRTVAARTRIKTATHRPSYTPPTGMVPLLPARRWAWLAACLALVALAATHAEARPHVRVRPQAAKMPARFAAVVHIFAPTAWLSASDAPNLRAAKLLRVVALDVDHDGVPERLALTDVGQPPPRLLGAHWKLWPSRTRRALPRAHRSMARPSASESVPLDEARQSSAGAPAALSARVALIVDDGASAGRTTRPDNSAKMTQPADPASPRAPPASFH